MNELEEKTETDDEIQIEVKKEPTLKEVALRKKQDCPKCGGTVRFPLTFCPVCNVELESKWNNVDIKLNEERKKDIERRIKSTVGDVGKLALHDGHKVKVLKDKYIKFVKAFIDRIAEVVQETPRLFNDLIQGIDTDLEAVFDEIRFTLKEKPPEEITDDLLIAQQNALTDLKWIKEKFEQYELSQMDRILTIDFIQYNERRIKYNYSSLIHKIRSVMEELEK